MSIVVYHVGMARNRKRTQPTPIELVDATYDDVVNEFCKRFDLPPIAVARVLLSIDDSITRTALHIAFDAGLYFGKTHPDKVAITLPPPPLPLLSVPSMDERRTCYVRSLSTAFPSSPFFSFTELGI